MFKKIMIAGVAVILFIPFLLLAAVCLAVIAAAALLFAPFIIPVSAGIGALYLADSIIKKLTGRKVDGDPDFTLPVIASSVLLFPLLIIPVTLFYIPVVAIVELVVGGAIAFGGPYFSAVEIVDYIANFMEKMGFFQEDGNENENENEIEGTHSRLINENGFTPAKPKKEKRFFSLSNPIHFSNLFKKEAPPIYNVSDEELAIYDKKEDEEHLDGLPNAHSEMIMPIYKTTPPDI